MKRSSLLFALIGALTLGHGAVTAQTIGIGAGIAAAGTNIGQAGGELNDFFQQEQITYGGVADRIGFYGSINGRLGLLDFMRITADASYIYFQAAQVTLQSASINQADSTVNATFEVGTSMIPIYVGGAIELPLPIIKPYIGAQVGYTYINRTYSYVRGSDQLRDVDLSNKSTGDPEFGLAISAGVDLALGIATVEVGGRYTLANLFSTSGDDKPMRYLELGAAVYFGGGF